MKHQIQHVLAACVWGGSLVGTAGCERALDVVDQLQPNAPSGEPGDAPSEGEPASPPVQNAACACASSASLMALTCGGGEVPNLENDIVQTTDDGGIVVFSRCSDTFVCEVMYWNGGNPVVIGDGLLVGMDAAGKRALASNGPTLIDVTGGKTTIPIDPLPGRGMLNAAGDTIIGAVFPATDDPLPAEAEWLARANAAGEVEKLGALPGYVAWASANPAGTTVVGFGYDASTGGLIFLPFRWSATGGLRFDFPGVPDNITIWPESVSADGAVIAGRTLPDHRHFRWSEADGYTELSSASWRSNAFISADGSVVLGSLDPDGTPDSAAFRWTAETGAVDLTPGRASLALDMSNDGAVIAAYSWEEAIVDGAPPEDTFIWNAADGTRTLDEITSERGIDTSGWEFGTPRALSGDGRVLLGRGTCGGVPTLYRIVLSD